MLNAQAPALGAAGVRVARAAGRHPTSRRRSPRRAWPIRAAPSGRGRQRSLHSRLAGSGRGGHRPRVPRRRHAGDAGIVTYENNRCGRVPDGSRRDEASRGITGFASAPDRADGRYEFRYVRQDTAASRGDGHDGSDTSGALRTVTGYVRAAGEQIVLDIALFGRGTVTGIVRTSPAPVPGAQVVAVSDTDPQVGGPHTTDGDGRYTDLRHHRRSGVRQAARAPASDESGRIDRAGATAHDRRHAGRRGGARLRQGPSRWTAEPSRPPLASTWSTALDDQRSAGGHDNGADGTLRLRRPARRRHSVITCRARPRTPRARVTGVGRGRRQLTGQDLVIVIARIRRADPGAVRHGAAGSSALPGGTAASGVRRLPRGPRRADRRRRHVRDPGVPVRRRRPAVRAVRATACVRHSRRR